jgi:CubicO group peptidase (beta-lactamase class C family)
MKYFLLTLILLIACGYLPTNAQTNKQIVMVENSLVGPSHEESFKGWSISDRMAHYKVNGISIAVIRNYKIEWAKGYGFADVANKTPVTTTTRFQAGSISKSLNAVGVLKLAGKEGIDLNADVNKYLVSWKVPYNKISKGKAVNISQLLSHTAGFNVSGFSGYMANQSIPSTVQILKGKHPSNSPAVHIINQPGIIHQYSGGGTIITQLLIEDITHKHYDTYMQSEVLKPLGMVNSSFANPGKGNTKNLLATGYYENGKQVEGKYHIYPEKAAAGLWTTPSDLAKYIIALQEAYRGKQNNILSSPMAKLMLTPNIDQRAGLGVFIDNYNGEKYFGHGGLTFGFYSQYYGSLTNGNGVVVMTNSVNADIVPEIINSVANVYGFKGLYRSKVTKSFSVNESILESYTGSYRLGPDEVLTVSKIDKQLFIKLTGQDKVAIYPETVSKFYLKVVDAQLEFIKDANGKIKKVVLYQDGSANDAPKIK